VHDGSERGRTACWCTMVVSVAALLAGARW